MISKNMWEKYPSIWKTQSAYMSWVRGGIRRSLWNHHPIKLEFMRSKTIMIENTNPRSSKRFPEVKGCKCELCDGIFKITECEVDHKTGNHSLKDMDDLRGFIEAIIEIDFDDLQMVCKECHKTKSYADKYEITFNEAKATRMAIAIVNSKKDKHWLEQRGIVPASAQAKRREQIIKEILNGN